MVIGAVLFLVRGAAAGRAVRPAPPPAVSSARRAGGGPRSCRPGCPGGGDEAAEQDGGFVLAVALAVEGGLGAGELVAERGDGRSRRRARLVPLPFLLAVGWPASRAAASSAACAARSPERPRAPRAVSSARASARPGLRAWRWPRRRRRGPRRRRARRRAGRRRGRRSRRGRARAGAAVSARTVSAWASAASGSGGGELLAEDRELVQGRGQLGAEPAHRRQGVVADGAGPADRRGDRPAAVVRLPGELLAAAERRQRGMPDQHEGAVAVLGHLLLAVAGLPARRPGVPGRVRAAGIPACPGSRPAALAGACAVIVIVERVLSRPCGRTARMK